MLTALLSSVFFKSAKDLLLKLLCNWRVLVAIIVLLIAGIAYHKYVELQAQLTASTAQLNIEKTNNTTLQVDLSKATAINNENTKIIEQQQLEAKTAQDTINTLNDKLSRLNASADKVKIRVSEIKTPPVKVSTYILEAVRGIQDLRDGKETAK